MKVLRSAIFLIFYAIMLVAARNCRKMTKEDVEERFEKYELYSQDVWQRLEGYGYGKIPKNNRKYFVRKAMKEINDQLKSKNLTYCMEINEIASMTPQELEAFTGGKNERYLEPPTSYYEGLDNITVSTGIANGVNFSQTSMPTRSYYLNRYQNKEELSRQKRQTYPLPDYVDWTKNMGPVENQKGCACCWAFAASHGFSAVESVLKKIEPNDYSEQELINCVYPRDGCIGGYTEDAWNYWFNKDPQIGCIHHYSGQYDGECVRSESGSSGITGWRWCSWKGDEEGMKALVSEHPVVVSWYANPDFYRYSSGVYDTDEMCGEHGRTNHAMVIAGYGTDWEAGDYWLLKNSWGPNWGMNGYVKVKRGKNLCNIASYCMYPTIQV